MMRTLLPLFLLPILSFSLTAQSDYYFPPTSGSDWETISPGELNWCDEKLDSLQAFLEVKNTRSFIVLYKGRIILEHYFGNTTENSFWYLASAGKSVMGFMMGMAQEQGYLAINDQTSIYLGEGWTVAPPEKEDLITIWHQLTMTTGLDDVPDVPGILDPANCLDPECLIYLEDAGTRWAYHNAPYRRTQDVLGTSIGQTVNQYTNTLLNDRIGTAFFWLNYVCWGKARDAARFGLLTLNNGVWDTDTLLADQDYFQSMVSTSQDLNKSYGYLWWLNGKESYMAPGSQLVFPGSLIPDAPDDLIAALGLNDQKIYVVPSMDLVVVRQGDAAGDVLAGPSSFDNQLWIHLMNLSCTTSAVEYDGSDWKIWPLPAQDNIEIQAPTINEDAKVTLYNLEGQVQLSRSFTGNLTLSVASLPKGIYLLEVHTSKGVFTRKWVIQ